MRERNADPLDMKQHDQQCGGPTKAIENIEMGLAAVRTLQR
ncbi:hypothetical protein [Xanthomonas melonis]|nr:hypothetical protein [Xanthomonas melonis]